MQGKPPRFVNTQSTKTSENPNQINNIFISTAFESEIVFLILDNRGESTESIYILYEERDSLGRKTLEMLDLPCNSQQKIQLPKGFERWKNLIFRVSGKRRRISNTTLRKLSDAAQNQKKTDISQSETEPSIPITRQTDDSQHIIGKNLPHKREKVSLPKSSLIDYQQEAETLVKGTCNRVRELARAYKDGEPIDFVNIENPTPSQNVAILLNFIGITIRTWIKELQQQGETHCNLIDTLTYGEQDIRTKLKSIRGNALPVPNQLEFDTDIKTDKALDEIRKECVRYTAWFEGRLFGYEERCEISDFEEYNQFFPQFIKDRLFNGAARFIRYEPLPEHLDTLLQLVGYEIVPIEIGKTKADARVHDIQECRQTRVNPGTIAEVILSGLRRQVDGEIVQKPVVIRGE